MGYINHYNYTQTLIHSKHQFYKRALGIGSPSEKDSNKSANYERTNAPPEKKQFKEQGKWSQLERDYNSVEPDGATATTTTTRGKN